MNNKLKKALKMFVFIFIFASLNVLLTEPPLSHWISVLGGISYAIFTEPFWK